VLLPIPSLTLISPILQMQAMQNNQTMKIVNWKRKNTIGTTKIFLVVARKSAAASITSIAVFKA